MSVNGLKMKQNLPCAKAGWAMGASGEEGGLRAEGMGTW